MIDMKAVYKKYADIDIGDLSNNQKDAMYNILRKTKPEDLCSIDDHRMYIEVLQKLRMASMKDMERVGAKFLQTLKSLLAVGEDGVYSNSQRFIYELIQNVDDCDYENIEDCQLEIQFKYHTSPGEIILTYNEKGFKPENVFAITGIAEKSKNISSDKVEIGEKGIGFKSVFGIAEKVHIESGKFSFELYRDNFTVPIPKYDEFVPVEGTRLTLTMPTETVKRVYRSMVKQYMKKDAALNKNPILFLNKLTHLKMYFDGFRYIVFDVERKTPEQVGNIAFENNVIVSIDMKDYNNGIDMEYSSSVLCKRYTQSLIYGEKECKSRYGDDAPFSERRHNLIAIFPELSERLTNFKGLLYSFLPTQIQMTAPIVLHVPFKLDGSREFVDPQGKNLWFKFTTNNLSKFLEKIYLHLSGMVKQDIISYIPNHQDFFFKKTNEKVQCLQREELKGDTICQEKIFYTVEGTFETAENVVAFAKNEVYKKPIQIFSFLGEVKKLFIPNISVDMKQYGVHVITDVPSVLFKRGLSNESVFAEIAEILETIEGKLEYEKLIRECCPLELTKSQLRVIGAHKKIYDALNQYSYQCLSRKKIPEIVFPNNLDKVDKAFQNEIVELLNSADLDSKYEEYLEKIGYKFLLLDGINQEFAVAGQNAIVLAKGFEMGSFGRLTEEYDSKKVFVASLQIRQASQRLNEVDESISNKDYLELLRSVRVSLKNAFGTKMYENYIRIINQAGGDKNRFLNELLQNADDCKYPRGEEPNFDLEIRDKQIKVFYNELGFTKQNVRAITAIGESTKKLLLDGKDHSIGEKGVGFKSVFGVAESVEIHSNQFHFKLTDKTPTIPEKCKALEYKGIGTTLVFHMKEDVRQSLTEERILNLCLCLRNLKLIIIQGRKIQITDKKNERKISIDNKIYHFERFTHTFEITDEDAIKEKSVNQRVVSKNQVINFYLPTDDKEENYYLYVGLPTEVKCRVPIIIDAPFELTTARNNVIQCRWNELVREAVYTALLRLMVKKRDELRIDVLKYVKFEMKNGDFSYPTFSEKYLNLFDWESALKKEKIIPVLNSESFISVSEAKCWIVPDIIAFISKKSDITRYCDKILVDTYTKSQYIPLLVHIECEKISIKLVLECVKLKAGNLIHDKHFRKGLYKYLMHKETQESLKQEKLYSKVKELSIFPIRKEDGVEYVPFSSKIYMNENKKSDDNFWILETKIMDCDTLEAILGKNVRINELNEDVYQAHYQKNLINYIKNEEIENREKALHVLNEFVQNYSNFDKCKDTLKGVFPQIPMRMSSGNFKTGNKFINESDFVFKGRIIKELIVADEFRDLAKYLECTGVLGIHYDDIDLQLEKISDDDIEEFQYKFKFYAEILEFFIKNGIISDEQIEKFHLEYLIASNDADEDNDEEFPGRAVVNLQRLRSHIENRFRINPNPYVQKIRIEKKPKYRVDKEAYTMAMYESEYNSQKCFCQMCRRKTFKKYIERNDVQRTPKYGWEQMYLSLCLKCSKDYTLLRRNDFEWKKFIENIMEADVEGKEVVEVEIGNKTLIFTATHLAEIQTIFELEKNETC